MPKRHRSVMAAVALVTCLGIGLWMGAVPEIPVVVSGGAVIGLLAGAVLGWVMLHDWHAQSHRAQRPRH